MSNQIPTVEIDVEDLRRTLMLLDAAQDALDAAAVREKRKEAGKRLRCITAQQRAKATRAHLLEMLAEYELEIE